MSIDHSRAMKLATGVSASPTSKLQQRLDEMTVVISLDPDLPESYRTARVLLTTLRRGPGNLVLLADGLADDFVTVAQHDAEALNPERRLRVALASERRPRRSVRLHVGPTCSDRAIRIAPDGYGAHIASSTTASIRISRAANGLGAVYTAGLGAAEVFKFTARVQTRRRVFHRHLTFCPVTLGGDLGIAPDLPGLLNLDLTLVGVGAIGTGIVLILSSLPAEGRLLAIDRQRFGSENVGTYSVGDLADAAAGLAKVEFAKRTLHGFDVPTSDQPVANVIAAIDGGDLPWTPTVLTALDSPEARRDAQRLWPDHLIDAQTGDTTLGIYDYVYGLDPCLVCHFPIDRNQPSGADAITDKLRELGLPNSLLEDPEAPLSEAHLTPDNEAVLRPHLGTPVCGLARALGLSHLDSGDFMASIPFVSLQAACLSVGRLLATTLALPAKFNLVQYDVLLGPQAVTLLHMDRRPGCVCQTRRAAIDRTRELRRGHQPKA